MNATRITSAIVGLFFTSITLSRAIVGLGIERDCEDIVISWPSTGPEHYLIQYRPTLDPSTPWQNLTNNYPANSTTRTTYRVSNVVPPCSGGSSLMMSAAQSLGPVITEPQVMPADGSRQPVPLAIYPPGIDLTGHVVIWPDGSSEAWSKAVAEGYATSRQLERQVLSFDGPILYGAEEAEGEGDSQVTSGFYRVFHIPDWALNVTNYIYDGPIFLPVDFKDYRDRVRKAEVLLNGESSPHAEFTEYENGGVTNWGVGIYFDRIPNGAYQVQLVTTLALNELTGDRTSLLTLSNLPRSILVSNIVIFPDWNDFIQGDTYTFKAKTLETNVNWWVDVYDQWGNYVNTGSGQTSNGDITWTWDLNDWLGNNRDDFNSDPFFYAEIGMEAPIIGNATNLPQPAPVYRPAPVAVKGFPDRGEWLIAYQDRWFSDAPYYSPVFQTEYIDAINNIAGGPWLVGDTAYQLPLKLGTNIYTQAEREASWTTFRNAIGDLRVRNLYYHGHGGPTMLGCDYHELSPDGEIIAGLLSYAGTRSVLENWQIAKKTKYNRFRFVFLDGCSTAAGDLPNAFNISKQTNAISFYETHAKHPRPAVFVGWIKDVGDGDGWGFQLDQIEFQSYWMGRWANSSLPPSIETAIDIANQTSEWLTRENLWSWLRIYGYQQMTIRDYNRKGDWRWP